MLRDTAQLLTDLPPISQESRRLIAAFFDVDQNIEDLAAELRQDLFDVIARLTDPAIKSWIVAMSALKNNERRERALRTLDATQTNSHDPKLIHRAASRLLKHLEASREPRTARLDATMPSGHDAFSASTPPRAPHVINGTNTGTAAANRQCTPQSPHAPSALCARSQSPSIDQTLTPRSPAINNQMNELVAQTEGSSPVPDQRCPSVTGEDACAT